MPGIDGNGNLFTCGCGKSLTHVELLCLPREQTFFDLLRELVRVGRRLVSERRQVACELMLSVAVGGSTRKPRNDDERTECPDRTHHFRKRRLFSPYTRRFCTRFRESVVHHIREHLLAAVKTPRLQEFLRTDDTERLEQLWPDDVLTAFAAI